MLNKYYILTASPSVNNKGKRKNASARKLNPGSLAILGLHACFLLSLLFTDGEAFKSNIYLIPAVYASFLQNINISLAKCVSMVLHSLK